MILVTGGTGFIGKALIRHLVELGHPVRTLIRPSQRSPNLPRGVPVNVAVAGLNDERGLRAAMVGIKTVYHLAGAERGGPRASLLKVDIQGTRSLVKAAEDADVKRFFYLSHLGADRASAYPVLKAKAIGEEFIRNSSLAYTILRTAVVFGPNDNFTTNIARTLSALPVFYLMPGDGSTLLQPLWVEDLVTCMSWSLEDPETYERTIEVGGPEYISFRQIVELVMEESGVRRRLLGIGPPYLRAITVTLDSLFQNLPISVFWLDYMAVNRTCALDTLPRTFNLMPSRMSQHLAYLHGERWGRLLVREIWRRSS